MSDFAALLVVYSMFRALGFDLATSKLSHPSLQEIYMSLRVSRRVARLVPHQSNALVPLNESSIYV